MFFWSLQTTYLGYLNVTTLQIINHLYNQYTWISAADLQENNVALKNAEDPNLPIETLFEQVENSVNFDAARNNLYYIEQLVANAYQLIYATVMFLNDSKIRKWHSEAYKTW